MTGRTFNALPTTPDDTEHPDGYRYFINDNEVSKEQYVAEWDREMAQEWEVAE